MGKYTAAIFDFDGTLASTFSFHTHTIQRFLYTQGYDVEKARVGATIGNTLNAVFSGCGVPECEHEHFAALLNDYYATGVDDLLSEVIIGDNIKETLCKLRALGVKTAVLTNSLQPIVQKILDYNHISDCFDMICGAGPDSLDKETRYKAIRARLSLDQENTLCIGDTVYDIQLANRFGLPACIIQGDFGWAPDYKALVGEYHPAYFLKTFDELTNLF